MVTVNTLTAADKGVCGHCGGEFTVNRRGRPRRYCSSRCQQAARRKGRPALQPADIEATDVAGVLAELAVRLVVPHGLSAGRPPTLQPWMLGFVSGAFAPAVRESALSVARKNAKSSLVALVLLAHLSSAKLRPPGTWRAVVASETGGLAAELRDLLAAFLAASSVPHTVRKFPAPGNIEARDCEVSFLNASKATGLAVGANLAIVDEAGILGNDKRGLWDSMASCVAARRDGRFLALGAEYRGPMFLELLDRADSPAVHVARYRADAGCDIDDEAAWAAANPGLGVVKSMDYMRHAAARAIEQPTAEAGFRGHDLNQPVDAERVQIVTVAQWRECVAEALPERAGGCYLGIDLGGSVSMSALVAYWPATGRLESYAALPGIPALQERERADVVPAGSYAAMRDAGELTVYAGERITPVPRFLGECAMRLRGARVLAAGGDRYRQAELEQAIDDAGLRWPFLSRGTGAGAKAQGSADVRAFQRAVLTGRVRHRPSALMAMAIGESELRFDDAGNPALAKGRTRGRIDALQAGVIACGLADEHAARRPRGFRPRLYIPPSGAI